MEAIAFCAKSGYQETAVLVDIDGVRRAEGPGRWRRHLNQLFVVCARSVLDLNLDQGPKRPCRRGREAAAKKSPKPIDQHVGSREHMRSMMLGSTAPGSLTFHQVGILYSARCHACHHRRCKIGSSATSHFVDPQLAASSFSYLSILRMRN
jgi:hypothetical protein